MSVVLYSTPQCFRCDTVKRHLDKRAIAYTEVDLYEDIDAAKKFREMGLKYVPVLEAEVNGELQRVEGYRPDFIDGLVESVAS